MKKSIKIFVLLGVIVLLSGFYVVKSEDDSEAQRQKTEQLIKYWCKKSEGTSAAQNFGKFASNYTLEKEKLVTGSSYANGDGTITYNYVYMSNGNLSIEYKDSRDGRQVRYPDASNNISIDIVLPRKYDQISLHSYPNDQKANPFTDASLSAACDPTIVAPGSDGNDEYFIQELSFSLPVPEEQSAVDPSGFTVDSGLDVSAANRNVTTDGDLYCQFDTNENKKRYQYMVQNSSNNGYFEVDCKETLDIDYDSPKQTYPGGGFKYTVGLNVTSQCMIVRKKVPQLRNICKPTFYFTDHNDSFGGPNEDFDNCISNCDGGLYTKKCSDVCYSKVYGNSKTKNIDFKESSKGQVEQLIVTPGQANSSDPIQSDPWCYVDSYNDPPPERGYRKGQTSTWHWQVCPSAYTKSLGKSATITVYPGRTTSIIPNTNESYKKTGVVYGCVYGYQGNSCKGKMVCQYGSKCDKNSVETAAQQSYYYAKELEVYYSDLREVLKNLNINTDPKSFNQFGEWLPEVQQNTSEALKGASLTRTVNYDSKRYESFESLSSEIVNNTAYINFPAAFIKLENGKIKYENINSKKLDGYIYGGHLFYTDVNATAKDTNDSRYYPTTVDIYDNEEIKPNQLIAQSGLKSDSTYGNDSPLNWNVKTMIKNLGTKNQWNIDVNCFYGTYDYKEKDLANLPYKYRTVTLSDLFPNGRNPGYNWTSNDANKNASSSSYQIQPDTLTSSIQALGDSIYSSTPYMSLSIGNRGQFNWNNIQSNSLYTDFDGGYSTSNGISFFESDLLKGQAKSKSGTNRTD